MTHIFPSQTRRRLLRGAAEAAALSPFLHALARAQDDPVAAATARLQDAIVAAALGGRPARCLGASPPSTGFSCPRARI